LNCFLDLGDFGGYALMSSQKLTLCQTISVVLLIKNSKYWISSIFAGFLNIFLFVNMNTMKIALGTLFSSYALCYSDNPLINLS
jgi:hypothetical protein